MIVKLLSFVLSSTRGSRVVEGGSVFGWAVLEALLEWLDHILQCQSAGALHWFFTLLNHVKWCNPWGTARKVSWLPLVFVEMFIYSFIYIQLLLFLFLFYFFVFCFFFLLISLSLCSCYSWEQ